MRESRLHKVNLASILSQSRRGIEGGADLATVDSAT